MITESVSFQLTTNHSLVLSKLAVIGSAKILMGMRWIPFTKYDIYGAPVLPHALIQTLLKEKEFNEALGIPYTIQVRYKQAIPAFNSSIFTNQDYINFKLRSISGLLEYFSEIKKYKKAYPNYSDFGEFVLYGKFFVDNRGNVMALDKRYNVPDELITMAEFKKLYHSYEFLPFPVESMISSPLRCPYCSQEFTLNDILQDNLYWQSEEGITHRDCQDHFYELENKADLFSIIHYSGWDASNYTEIPNEYGCNCEICKNRPWFIFHTSNGDIKIGWRKRVISIEFMEGFTEFPMSIFEDEDVTKWEKGIHAWNKEKAIDYLAKVYHYLH